MFRFKNFSVSDDRSAMKVGTDAVLLGGIAAHDHPRNILDIGTGCGIIALMMAQRYPDAMIYSVEIDPQAAKQAQENFKNAPFDNIAEVSCCDLKDYQPSVKFDMVVCNPPFFEFCGQIEEAARTTARQQTDLQISHILKFAENNLFEEGCLFIICPSSSQLHELTTTLQQLSRTDIKGNPHSAVKRSIYSWKKTIYQQAFVTSLLVIEESRGVYNTEYKALLRDFYLKF